MAFVRAQAARVEGAAPMQDPDGDEDAERGQHEDGGRGDRCVKIATLELAVDDKGEGLRPALDAAGEHDRRAELAERAGPRHDEARREGSCTRGAVIRRNT